MSSQLPSGMLSMYHRSIDDLPDEVLEYILSLVPPYKDLQECSIVCKRWNRSVKNVIRHTMKSLNRAISDYNIIWENVAHAEMAPTITKRYSHSACRHENSMYVFGGCTSSNTTFNDLWRLDLNKRHWIRPLTMGTYPSPKACASIVYYKNSLILFGGWTHPSPYPLHQAWRLFNELHIYNIDSNRWTCINTPQIPPPMAGHSATVQGELMVVYGGLQSERTNDVWCLDLETQLWNKQATSDVKPHSRYGQSQISLDEKNILIIGGCGGPNMVFSDVWLLSMTEPVWTWSEVAIRNPQWAPSHMWCHPACKVGDTVVLFSRNPDSNLPAFPYPSKWNNPAQLRMNVSNLWVPPREDDLPADVIRRAMETLVEQRPVDRDRNVNGRRGTFGQRPSTSAANVASPSSSSGEESEPEGARHVPHLQHRPLDYPRPVRSISYDMDGPGALSMAAFRDPPPAQPTNSSRNRQRRIEFLMRMEEKIRNLEHRNNDGPSIALPAIPAPAPPAPPPRPPGSINSMAMFVLDISKVLTEGYVEWLPLKSVILEEQPEVKILYTLVAGKGELIMFGGIQKDASSITTQTHPTPNITNAVTNSLHFISAPRGII